MDHGIGSFMYNPRSSRVEEVRGLFLFRGRPVGVPPQHSTLLEDLHLTDMLGRPASAITYQKSKGRCAQISY